MSFTPRWTGAILFNERGEFLESRHDEGAGVVAGQLLRIDQAHVATLALAATEARFVTELQEVLSKIDGVFSHILGLLQTAAHVEAQGHSPESARVLTDIEKDLCVRHAEAIGLIEEVAARSVKCREICDLNAEYLATIVDAASFDSFQQKLDFERELLTRLHAFLGVDL